MVGPDQVKTDSAGRQGQEHNLRPSTHTVESIHNGAAIFHWDLTCGTEQRVFIRSVDRTFLYFQYGLSRASIDVG